MTKIANFLCLRSSLTFFSCKYYWKRKGIMNIFKSTTVSNNCRYDLLFHKLVLNEKYLILSHDQCSFRIAYLLLLCVLMHCLMQLVLPFTPNQKIDYLSAYWFVLFDICTEHLVLVIILHYSSSIVLRRHSRVWFWLITNAFIIGMIDSETGI